MGTRGTERSGSCGWLGKARAENECMRGHEPGKDLGEGFRQLAELRAEGRWGGRRGSSWLFRAEAGEVVEEPLKSSGQE